MHGCTPKIKVRMPVMQQVVHSFLSAGSTRLRRFGWPLWQGGGPGGNSGIWHVDGLQKPFTIDAKELGSKEGVVVDDAEASGSGKGIISNNNIIDISFGDEEDV
jgi:hypothetical protein